MALDRQRILSELGSVMNQLKSVDCGCMNKLFGQSGQASPSPGCGGCRGNCCHSNGHGWKPNGSCGESYQGNAQNSYTPCMGSCNPRKLYADTHNYLTDNLIQPTIKEVYDDLKSLTPDNTITNNPMAKQMGLSSGSAAQGNMGDMSKMQASHMGCMSDMANMNGNTGNMMAGNDYNNINSQSANASYMPTNAENLNQMGHVGGMGPQIMNMLGDNVTSQNKTNPGMGQNAQLTQPMLFDAAQSPKGQIGVTPFSAPMTTNQDVYNAQGFPSSYNVNQGMMQSTIKPGGNIQNIANINPSAQQMATGHLGHHSKGVAKFNEMFPGVMKNLGGDLGFDPMAIAIQMKPANQHQAAVNSKQKLMQNNNINKVFDQSANPALPAQRVQQNQIQNNVLPNHAQESISIQQIGNDTVQPNATSTDPMAYRNAANYNKAINDNVNVYGYPKAQLNNQQAYMAGMPVPNQYTQPDQQQYQFQQQNIDPNTGSEMAPPNLSSAYEATPNHAMHQAMHPGSPNNQRVIKEPILPVDTSRYLSPKHLYFGFNTLGQPVEKTSAEMYRSPEPSLPQTLSPQPLSKPRTDSAKYAKVKSTVSKTSLMGAKALDRTPSQLQHIYNQYKGSQSFTQQNIPAQGVNAVTHSEGKLNAPHIYSQQRQMPVERIGGDTVASNLMRDQRTVKVEQVMGQIGDVPAVMKPTGDEKLNEMSPVMDRKTRNGLQDMIYTSYPSSTAWTFHGASTRPCSSARGRYRGRNR